MEPSFWIARWAEGRIGFHEGKPNSYLRRHADRIADARRVLVPLCGKALDLSYLAGLGHEGVITAINHSAGLPTLGGTSIA